MCNKAGEVDCHGPETEVVETWGLVFHGVRLLGKSDQNKRMTTSVPNNVNKLRHLDISGEEGHVGGAEEEEKQKQNKKKWHKKVNL